MKTDGVIDDPIKRHYHMIDMNQQCIAKLHRYVMNHKLSDADGGGCEIHGGNGAVYWSDIQTHPKVKAKITFAKERSK